MRRTLAILFLAAACAGAGGTRSPAAPGGGPSFRYRVAGQPAARSPLWVQPLAEGRVEYQLLSAGRASGVVTLERAVVNKGEDPVRVDVGRIRLRAASGDELGLVQACAGGECHEGSAARGQITQLEPGQTLRLRAEFGPVAADDAFDKATFVDEGLYVGGKLALVAVELERQ
jgi:hypothetical protein